MSTAEFTAPAAPGAETVEYASYGRRLGAALLDSLVWIIGIGFLVPESLFESIHWAAVLGVLLVFTAWFNYFAFCEWRWGQTIGKNATGIRVLPLEGGKLSWQAAALRNLLRLVELPLTFFGVTYMVVTKSPRSQRLGDRAAKTIVVRERSVGESGTAAGEGGAAAAAAPAPAAPTAAELFGDAAEALSRQPGAGSAPPAPPESVPEEPDPRPDPPPAGVQPLSATRVQWSAPGFPYATWDLRRSVTGLVGGLLAALLLPVLVLPFDPDLDSAGSMLGVQAVFEAALIGAAVGVASGAAAGPSGPWPLLGLRRFRRSALGVAAQAMLAYYSFTALYSVFVRPEQEDIARDLGLDASPLAAIGAVVLIAGVAPVVEEVFFRGMLFGGLRKRMNMYAAAAISATVFGGLHATTGVNAVPPLIAFGFVLALLYERTGSLGPPIIVHMINNSLALAVAS
ncbi:MAG: CPBP family glutamic-type intramembrane protease [Actinomycetota bacterium]